MRKSIPLAFALLLLILPAVSAYGYSSNYDYYPNYHDYRYNRYDYYDTHHSTYEKRVIEDPWARRVEIVSHTPRGSTYYYKSSGNYPAYYSAYEYWGYPGYYHPRYVEYRRSYW